MNYQSLPPLPSGIRSSFEVLSFEGVSGNKKWILLDLDSRKEYRLDPSMLADREIKEGDIPESGPRIISYARKTRTSSAGMNSAEGVAFL